MRVTEFVIVPNGTCCRCTNDATGLRILVGSPGRSPRICNDCLDTIQRETLFRECPFCAPQATAPNSGLICRVCFDAARALVQRVLQ